MEELLLKRFLIGEVDFCVLDVLEVNVGVISPVIRFEVESLFRAEVVGDGGSVTGSGSWRCCCVDLPLFVD